MAELEVEPRAVWFVTRHGYMSCFPQKLQGTSGPLLLTEEEKRTLIAEGYPIPTKLPLTKAEEKALKRVRRKIKNKISAQESRRKKKEYVECLEKKVETFTSENNELWKKVETLENANRWVVPPASRPAPCLLYPMPGSGIALGGRREKRQLSSG